MNVLILGSGGREYALGLAVAQSEKSEKVFFAPGNGGTGEFGLNLSVNPKDFEAIKEAVLENNVDMVIVGPEAPLVEGVVDFFKNDEELKDVKILGPDKEAAQLEGSKSFAKQFMSDYNIPTASYEVFTNSEIDKIYNYISEAEYPIVLKADGLAAGKGVVIANTEEVATETVRQFFEENKLGEAGKKLLVEEFLQGTELSIFILTDGKDYLLLPEAKDYKQIGEGNTGLNTGGMGAISPVPFAKTDLIGQIEKEIIEPCIQGISDRKFDYKGFLYIGLMITAKGPKVLEFNVRMGDPETQVVLSRIESDILSHFESCLNGDLGAEHIEIDDRKGATVVAASEGYPESYEKGKKITGLKEALQNAQIHHAGTRLDDNELYTNGGRVLAATALGEDHHSALAKAYDALNKLCYEGIIYRKDIGFDLDL